MPPSTAETAPVRYGARGPARPRAVLTIGKFDGVHAGHRHLIARLVEEAGARSAEPVALVLDPHPQTVLGGSQPEILTNVAERRSRLEGLGVARAEPLAFTHSLAALTPSEFVARLVAHFRITAMVVGPDFVFGRDRAGDLATLRALGAREGFDVVVVEPLRVHGEVVSSRRIRELLGSGAVNRVRTLLRKPHQVEGIVVRGAARGRSLGFPTANLYLGDRFALPVNGIYAVRAHWSAQGAGRTADGVASVGVRPTFDNGERLLEVFLLDHDEDLYGRQVTVEFLAHQRAEERFESSDALVTQIGADVDLARRLLARESTAGCAPDGRVRSCAGFDLADLLTRIAAPGPGGDGAQPALGAEPGSAAGGPPAPGAAPGPAVRVELNAADDASLVAAWIAAVGGMASAQAYAAEEGHAVGIGWGTPRPGPPVRVRNLRRDEWDWVAADLVS